MNDVGLLAAKLNITSDQIVLPDALFKEFNSAFIENFIAQELASAGNSQLFYVSLRPRPCFQPILSSYLLPQKLYAKRRQV